MDQDTKQCPVCGETIKFVALKCRFCNTDLAAYAAAKEAEVEKELFTGHPAVFYKFTQYLWVLLLLALLLLALVFPAHFLAGLNIPLVAAGAVGISGCLVLYYWLQSISRTYWLTTQRIKIERNLFSAVQNSLELFRIDHFELRKPLSMRLLGYCRLHIFSSDREMEDFAIWGVPNLESLAETLRECQLRERTRRGLTTFVKA